MITASDDHTARVWATGSGEAALVIDSVERNLPARLQAASPPRDAQTAQPCSAVSSFSSVKSKYRRLALPLWLVSLTLLAIGK